jgi:hypothetical protein
VLQTPLGLSIGGTTDERRWSLARPGGSAIMARMPPARPTSFADLAAVIVRVTPDVLALLSDGVPRTKRTIVAALADRHAKQDATLTLMRLDVLGQLVRQGSRYLVATPASEPAERRTTRSGSRRSCARGASRARAAR